MTGDGLERFGNVLLDIWREACQHIEIQESTANIAELLARELPLAALLVRRFDPPHLAIDTVGIGEPGRRELQSVARTTCTARAATIQPPISSSKIKPRKNHFIGGF